LGAVLFQFADNTTGGYLKPETDAFHILRVRGGEWYMNNSGVVVRPGMDHGSDNGRNYHVEFKYGNTVIPEYPASGEASEKGTWVSNRHNIFFDINARAVWTKDGKTWGSQDENHDGYPDGDWGAWRIDVINDENLNSDTMTATMQITDSATEARQYGWYPSKIVTLDVCDFMNIKEVSWWDGT
jgi:hypothetical protein